MNCPVDQTALQMADRQGVEIDWCPTCRGVWLDRGELDKLIERTAGLSWGGQRPQPRGRDRDFDDDDDWDRQRQPFGDDQRKRPHKRRGMLGELFDFD